MVFPAVSPKSGLPSFFARLGRLAGIAVLPALLCAPAAFSQTEIKRPAHIDLSVSTIEGPSRTQATLTAKVAAVESDGSSVTLPTGSVSFLNGEQSIGSAFIDKDGNATYTATALPSGMQQITAVYQGDDNFKEASSTPAAVNSLATGVPTFSLSASTTSLKVIAGQTATTVITATPENGFNQAVTLSCSGVPYVSVTCIFNPSPVTPGAATTAAPNGTPVLSTLNIQTTAYNTQLREPGRQGLGGAQTAYAIVLPGVLALAGLGLARKRGLYSKGGDAARLMGLLFLLTASVLGMGGCSQLHRYYTKPPTGNPGTPAGTYTVVISGITGTGSSLTTATAQITLVVTIS